MDYSKNPSTSGRKGKSVATQFYSTSHCFDLKVMGAIFLILYISQVHLDIRNLRQVVTSLLFEFIISFVNFTNNPAILPVLTIFRFFQSIWTNLGIKIWWQLQNCGKMAGLLVKWTKNMKNSNKSDVTTCLKYSISRWTWELLRNEKN